MSELTTYDDVNNAWGGIVLPPITAKDAAPHFLKLVRKFAGRKQCAERRLPAWARRRNRSWASIEPQDMRVHRRGGAHGLPRLVHDASHLVFEWLHPTFRTHSAAHAAIEKAMIECVIEKGWHLPRAKPVTAELPVDQKLAIELANVEARIKRWQTKAKRAATALKKLDRKAKNLRRRVAAAN